MTAAWKWLEAKLLTVLQRLQPQVAVEALTIRHGRLKAFFVGEPIPRIVNDVDLRLRLSPNYSSLTLDIFGGAANFLIRITLLRSGAVAMFRNVGECCTPNLLRPRCPSCPSFWLSFLPSSTSICPFLLPSFLPPPLAFVWSFLALPNVCFVLQLFDASRGKGRWMSKGEWSSDDGR